MTVSPTRSGDTFEALPAALPDGEDGGGFCLVIGLDRMRGGGGVYARALRDPGADAVMGDLASAIALLTRETHIHDARRTGGEA